MPAQFKSVRADRRGHWIHGRRRHADSGRWSRTRLALTRLIDEHFRPGVVSLRALAQAVGVTDRSVRRWLSGEDRPAEELQLACEEWLHEHLQRGER